MYSLWEIGFHRRFHWRILVKTVFVEGQMNCSYVSQICIFTIKILSLYFHCELTQVLGLTFLKTAGILKGVTIPSLGESWTNSNKDVFLRSSKPPNRRPSCWMYFIAILGTKENRFISSVDPISPSSTEEVSFLIF